MTNAAVGRAARCCGGGNNRHLLVKVTQITRRPSREFQKKSRGAAAPRTPRGVVIVTEEDGGRHAGALPELIPTLTNFLMKAATAAGVPRVRI